jgi:hypothetical protein
VPGKNYCLLAIKLHAYEIQAALLRKKGIELRRWPTPTFGANTPPIYDSGREDNKFMDDFHTISIFGNWGDSIDLEGNDKYEVLSAEQNVKFVKDNVRLRLDYEGREWNRLIKRYDFLLQQREFARDRLHRITNQGTRHSAAQQDLDDVRELLSDIDNIERRKESLDLQLWLWDDSAW